MACLWRIRSFLLQGDQQVAKLAKRLKKMRDLLGSGRSVHLRETQRYDDVRKYKLYLRAMASYFPKPIDIPIIYYSAENSGGYLRRMTSQLEILPVPCNHLGCATTHLPAIAEHLGKRLAAREVFEKSRLAFSQATPLARVSLFSPTCDRNPAIHAHRTSQP